MLTHVFMSAPALAFGIGTTSMFVDAVDLHRGNAAKLAVMVNDTVELRAFVVGLETVEFCKTEAGSQL